MSLTNTFIHPAGIVEPNVQIGSGTKVWAFTHILSGAVIGKDCNICDHVFIESDVQLGDRVTVKCGVQIWDGISIEDDVFVGSRVTILKGVIIHENSVIGSGSVVTKNIPANEIWAGVPAKKVGDLNSATKPNP